MHCDIQHRHFSSNKFSPSKLMKSGQGVISNTGIFHPINSAHPSWWSLDRVPSFACLFVKIVTGFFFTAGESHTVYGSEYLWKWIKKIPKQFNSFSNSLSCCVLHWCRKQYEHCNGRWVRLSLCHFRLITMCQCIFFFLIAAEMGTFTLKSFDMFTIQLFVS